MEASLMLMLAATLAMADPGFDPKLFEPVESPWPDARSANLCDVHLEHHAMNDGDEFGYTLRMSAPEKGVSRVEAVFIDHQAQGIPSHALITESKGLDLLVTVSNPQAAEEEPRFLRLRKATVDWSKWPLAFTFPALDTNDPTKIVHQAFSVDPKAKKTDWGSCILSLDGAPGSSGCMMLSDRRGSCVADYEALHGLGPR